MKKVSFKNKKKDYEWPSLFWVISLKINNEIRSETARRKFLNLIQIIYIENNLANTEPILLTKIFYNILYVEPIQRENHCLFVCN